MIIKSLPIYVLRTSYLECELDLVDMVKLKLNPAPIIWEYEGQYVYIEMDYVAEIMDAIRDAMRIKKPRYQMPKITMQDGIALDYRVGHALTRRPGQKKLKRG